MFVRRSAARGFAAATAARSWSSASTAAAPRSATAGQSFFRTGGAAAAAGAAFTLAMAGATTVLCKEETSNKAPQTCPYDAKAVRKTIEGLLEDDPSIAPTLVRLAWHEAGTWDKNKKDGCPNSASMRHEPECKHAANAGLGRARDWLEEVKEAHPKIPYADLWAFAGCIAIASMGGPEVPFRWGRADAKESTTPDGRLPDASKDENHVRAVFDRMGFTDREAVALLGAHAVGMCYPQNSGYSGPWTKDPLSFINSFFQELVQTEWIVDKEKEKLQYTDLETRSLMMLPTDMALLFDPSYKQLVHEYAKDEKTWHSDFAKAFQKLLELGVSDKLHSF